MAHSYAPSFVTVDALRVGMFVHLDLGWMSHPFPLSSFRIGSQKQIDTIRSLGVERVRWCPERSETADAGAEGAAEPAAAPAAAESPEAAAARQRRAAAAADRASLRQCERQFREAARGVREIVERVASEPARAGADARTLATAIVQKMLCAGEMNIRVLSEAAGDRASTHGLNVAIISLLMARTFGFGADDMIDLGTGAMLHDIGKLELPSQLRHRDAQFSDAQLERWRGHVTHGVALGRRMGLSANALRVIAQHHEQADGRGFPLGVGAGGISAAARIVALVDRFDNLCNAPTPAASLTPHEALSLMFAQAQQQFDSTMLSVFIRMVGVYPPGSAVQLTDDRYARVISVNSTRPLKPRVQLLSGAAADDDAPPLDLESVPGLGIRRSLPPQQLPSDIRRRIGPVLQLLYGFEPVVRAEAECAEDTAA